MSVLYEEAKETIAAWCRDAERSARKLLAEAEEIRHQAQLDAQEILEDARQEARQIAATGGVGEPELIQNHLHTLAVAIDQLLDALQGVLSVVPGLSPPAEPAPPAPEVFQLADTLTYREYPF